MTNNEDGREVEYILEIESYPEGSTGVMVTGHSIKAWADENMKSVIESVAGVTNVYNGIPTKTQFSIYIDHRYNVEFVKNEIAKALDKAGKL